MDTSASSTSFELYPVTADNKQWTIPAVLEMIVALAVYEKEPDA